MKLTIKQISDITDISPQAIYKARDRDLLLPDDTGRYYDSENVTNATWLRLHGINPRTCQRFKQNTITENTEFDLFDLTGLPDNLLNLSLSDLMKKHGTDPRLTPFIDIYCKLVSANKIDISIQLKRCQLLPAQSFQYIQNYTNHLYNNLIEYSNTVVPEIIEIVKKENDSVNLSLIEKMKKDITCIADTVRETIKQELFDDQR